MPKTNNRSRRPQKNPVLEVEGPEYVKNEEKYLRMQPDKGVKVQKKKKSIHHYNIMN